MYDLSQHAQPIDAQQPCGPDLEYDGSFLALSQAASGKPEQQFGDTVIPAVEPDWRLVERLATEMLGKTKDLRVVAWLTEAATRLHGVPGFAAGVQLMNLLCEQYWDDVHPRLIIDGDNDPFLRIGALASLSSSGGSYADGSPIMRALRDALLANRALPIKVRDVEMAARHDAAASYSDAQIVSILKDAIDEGSPSVLALEQATVSAGALAALVEARMAGGEQPDFSALKTLLKLVSAAIGRAKTPEGDDTPPADSADAPVDGAEVASAGAPTRGAGLGEVKSRDDARRALQRVCAYLEKNEPSNPASLFARRAERLLGMDFMDIVRELSPDSMQHIQMLTGAKSSDE